MDLTPHSWVPAESISQTSPGAGAMRRALHESERRRQAAEIKLADRERQLGTAHQTIAAQDQRIGWLTAEIARLGGTTAPNHRNDAWRPGPTAA
jgi:hypothetical protein